MTNREPPDVITARDGVFAMIEGERMRQEKRWGLDHDMAHTDAEWLAIALKWFGKIAEAGLDELPYLLDHRVIQTAAVLVAWSETTTIRVTAAAGISGEDVPPAAE